MEEKSRSKDAGRVPPQDLDAEKSLLGAVMISENVLPNILTILKPHDFYESRHNIIFDAMCNLYDQHKPIDLLTLTNELKSKKQLKEIGGAPYLTELTNYVPTASHAKAYAEIISKAAIRRRLITAGEEISKKAYDDDVDTDTLIRVAEEE